MEDLLPHGSSFCYGVSYLIDHPPPPNATAQYLELDSHVVLWIYATLSDRMCDHVVGATTTFALWHKITDFFLANRAARYMILNRQYCNLKQGDLSVSKYARRMKLLTDGLADIDHALTEVDLITQFLHGLDKRLDTVRVVLGDQGLPFDTVLSRVTLAEESQEQRATEKNASAFALTGAGSSGGSCSTGGRATNDRGDHSSDRSNDRDGGDRGGRGAPHPPPTPTGDRRGRGCGNNYGRNLPLLQRLHRLLRPLRYGAAAPALGLGPSQCRWCARPAPRVSCAGLPGAPVASSSVLSSSATILVARRHAQRRLRQRRLPAPACARVVP
ncbi:uncharacterized protein [Aegilops tauschii subsp. strangulata]|uniref:uncharacterized protein n=1 Tax=Aegilops tauschii subsp. strangulata TaxID=200361 RepID=UPI001E1CA0C3|nr:uncharacterized protein LOC123497764 [Aegilops tauschii subsp. strangulata]